MKKQVSLVLLLLIPPVVLFYTLKWTHDAITAIAAVTLISYILSCWLYDKVVSDFKWSWFVGKETRNFCSKMFDSIGFTLIFATLTAATLICFSIFSPWGISHMTLPFPSLKSGWQMVYTVTFTILFVVVVPLGEEAFYRVF